MKRGGFVKRYVRLMLIMQSKRKLISAVELISVSEKVLKGKIHVKIFNNLNHEASLAG